MSYSSDYFVGALTCPFCNYTCGERELTRMQTKLCRVHGMKMYTVGDRLDIHRIEDSGYLLVNPPENAESFTLMTPWECPACDRSYNWARLAFERTTLIAVHDVALNKASIMSVNYLDDESLYFGWEIRPGVILNRALNKSRRMPKHPLDEERARFGWRLRPGVVFDH